MTKLEYKFVDKNGETKKNNLYYKGQEIILKSQFKDDNGTWLYNGDFVEVVFDNEEIKTFELKFDTIDKYKFGFYFVDEQGIILNDEDKITAMNKLRNRFQKYLDPDVYKVLLKPINYDVPIKDYQNANIVFGGASKEELLDFGFRELDDSYYLCKYLYCNNEISFNITIYKENNKVKIYVLDENFLQPYNYQSILGREEKWEYIKKDRYPYRTHVQVQNIMKELLDKNIIKGYTLGDYI